MHLKISFLIACSTRTINKREISAIYVTGKAVTIGPYNLNTLQLYHYYVDITLSHLHIKCSAMASARCFCLFYSMYGTMAAVVVKIVVVVVVVVVVS